MIIVIPGYIKKTIKIGNKLITHTVKVCPSKIKLAKKNQLAWKLAEISSDNAKLNKKSIEMVINRIIDNASVAIASLNRKSVVSSRKMALRHPKKMVQHYLELIQKKNLIVSGLLGLMEQQ